MKNDVDSIEDILEKFSFSLDEKDFTNEDENFHYEKEDSLHLKKSLKESGYKLTLENDYNLKSIILEKHYFSNFLTIEYFNLLINCKNLIIFLYKNNLLFEEHLYKGKIEKYNCHSRNSYRALQILEQNHFKNYKNKNKTSDEECFRNNIYKIGFNYKIFNQDFSYLYKKYNLTKNNIYDIFSSMRIILMTNELNYLDETNDINFNSNDIYDKTFNIIIIDAYHLFLPTISQNEKEIFYRIKNNEINYFEIFN